MGYGHLRASRHLLLQLLLISVLLDDFKLLSALFLLLLFLLLGDQELLDLLSCLHQLVIILLHHVL